MIRFAFDEQIASQPDAVQAVLEGARPPEIDPARPVLFAGQGTSLHACRVAAAWCRSREAEALRSTLCSGRAVEAHELALRLPIRPLDQVVVVTHGGRGRFAAAVLAKARSAGARTFAVVGEGAPEPQADEVVRTCAEERISHWRRKWETMPTAFNWIGSRVVYHEVNVVRSAPGEAHVYDPTEGFWLEPAAQSGHHGHLAIRAEIPEALRWGAHVLVNGAWTETAPRG